MSWTIYFKGFGQALSCCFSQTSSGKDKTLQEIARSTPDLERKQLRDRALNKKTRVSPAISKTLPQDADLKDPGLRDLKEHAQHDFQSPKP